MKEESLEDVWAGITRSVISTGLVAALFLSHAATLVRAEAKSDRAPPGGWKLADLTETILTLRNRSYDRGKRLFDQTHCTACHRQDDVGQVFGPDLTRLDARFQPLDILRDVLDPSRRIADARFDTWVFITDSGKTVTGLIERETDTIVRVLEKPPLVAPAVELSKSEIEDRKMSLTSMMPQGLLDGLTRDEIADLIAYVAARGDRIDPLVQPAASPEPPDP